MPSCPPSMLYCKNIGSDGESNLRPPSNLSSDIILNSSKILKVYFYEYIMFEKHIVGRDTWFKTMI